MKKSIVMLAAMAMMMVGTMSACAEKNPYPGYEKTNSSPKMKASCRKLAT